MNAPAKISTALPEESILVEQNQKTLIGVLASHDDVELNYSLARLLEQMYHESPEKLAGFSFLFTGGTFRRVIEGDATHKRPVAKETRNFLEKHCGLTCLPDRTEGGVTVLSYFVVQQLCSIVWPFLTPLTAHWLNPENLALTRLCDQWHVKRLMNRGSVAEWFAKEGGLDADRNRQPVPPILRLTKRNVEPVHNTIMVRKFDTWPSKLSDMTIALIAHDAMKERMVEFAIDHEHELDKFERILSTGTTGREVAANTRNLYKKIVRYQSGPKGGDIEIATEILYGDCHAVVFFIDPLHPHPHIEDIRVVFGACMIQDHVRMLTNEMQAREWMQRVVRPC
ncbi:MAG: methylglyoxal synthase [Ignavibacteriae bacterium]|nr:methylglyoxal synthase [Ignavibacteriota bacterium]